MSQSSLAAIITYNPWTIRAETTLAEIQQRFASLGVHHVPVVDAERKIVGLVSQTDIQRHAESRRLALVGAGALAGADEAEPIAADVMTTNVIAVTSSTSQRKALELMLAHRIHSLPVVDDGRLVGIVTSRDFLREFSYGELPASRETVAQLMKGGAEPIEPDASPDEALAYMQQMHVACLAVVQGGCPLGLVLERDLMGRSCDDAVLKHVRRTTPIRPGQRLFEAAVLMIEQELPAAVVINQANRLLGLVTEDHLLRIMVEAA